MDVVAKIIFSLIIMYIPLANGQNDPYLLTLRESPSASGQFPIGTYLSKGSTEIKIADYPGSSIDLNWPNFYRMKAHVSLLNTFGDPLRSQGVPTDRHQIENRAKMVFSQLSPASRKKLESYVEHMAQELDNAFTQGQGYALNSKACQGQATSTNSPTPLAD